MNDFWRSLEEYADSEEFRELIQRDYPSQSEALLDPVSRRRFLQLMGASLALAGLNGCWRPPTETIVPYVRQPEEAVPGKPLYFATAMPLAGLGTGLLVESHMGRPTKIEGNPLHPASRGATDVYAQAAVLDLWDPNRSKALTYRRQIRPWSAFIGALHDVLAREKKVQGAGLRILTGTVTSPTMAEQIRALLNEYPGAKWHQYEPAGRHHTRAGARAAFGSYLETIYRLDQADVVLAFGGEILSCSPGYLRYAQDFAQRRKLVPGGQPMNRLYAVESTPSSAGAMAEHRLPLAPSQIEPFAQALAARLGLGAASSAPISADQERWLSALAADLQQHRGTSLIVVSEGQPVALHALAHGLNRALGNGGRTVVYSEPVEANPVDEIASLRELTEDMDRAAVTTLIIVEGDPAYNAPADFEFAEKLNKVPLRIHLSLDVNQTSALCHWHIPAAHFLESWSDVRAFDGTVTILQPLIAPLYDGKTAHELLAAVSPRPQQTSYDMVREYWRKRAGKGAAEFERWWRKSLHDGVVEGSAFAPRAVTPRLTAPSVPAPPPAPASGQGSSATAQQRSPASGSDKRKSESQNSNFLEVVFRPDPCLFDGRFANNGWLQELPKPITKLTWDNAAYLSPATARRLGLDGGTGWRGGTVNAEVIEITLDGRRLRAPVWIVPGQADDTIELQLGYGRTRVGRVGAGAGYDAYRLRHSNALWSASAGQIAQTGSRYALAATQVHHTMEGRPIVRAATLEELRANPKMFSAETSPSLYPEYKYAGYAWGMSIDLNACIGCNACVIACQAENNIPVVGKEQVERSREMHWLRLDTYHKGAPENPETYAQPVLCMHCEKAPCEVVCPVAATSHSAEGLNDMVYNRCVGTRYCSNNCPYKVRRFNFLQYADWHTPSLKAMRNPDVTVRSRGVMEKCTYCVQRINHAKIDAEKEGRAVRDGEITTACQQACPAQAIVFGDINDKHSKVAQLKTEPRSYSLLEELNTRPRTTYLAAVRNPNPNLKK